MAREYFPDRISTLIVGLAIVLSFVIAANAAEYRHHGKALLPDQHETPGVIALTNQEKVCATKWGKDARHVTASMKRQVCEAYGVKVCNGKTVEIDHLISRELGGADDIANLWPQPRIEPGAHAKDVLENRLHRQVCSGQISLLEAQKRISQDWYAEYLRQAK